jgi:hypothetical protein
MTLDEVGNAELVAEIERFGSALEAVMREFFRRAPDLDFGPLDNMESVSFLDHWGS